jgi:hypothetical protein
LLLRLLHLIEQRIPILGHYVSQVGRALFDYSDEEIVGGLSAVSGLALVEVRLLKHLQVHILGDVVVYWGHLEGEEHPLYDLLDQLRVL